MTKEYDFSSISLNDALYEEEPVLETKEEKEKKPITYDFSDITLEDGLYPDQIESDSTKEYMYGLDKQRTFLGYAANYVDALYDSFTNPDTTLEDALAKNRFERTQKLYRNYDEYAFVPEEFETTATTAGRVTVDIADPVTFMLPAYKYAKAGSALKSIAYGAGYGTADAALRAEAEGREDIGKEVAIGAGFGTTGALLGIGGVKAFNALKNKISPQGQERIEEAIKAHDKEITNQMDLFGGEDTTSGVVKPTKVIYPDIRDDADQLSLFDEEELAKITREVVTPEKIEQVTMSTPTLNSGVHNLVEMEKTVEKLEAQKTTYEKIYTPEGRKKLAEVEAELETVRTKFHQAQGKFVGDQLDRHLARVDMAAEVADRMSEQRTLTDKIADSLVYHTTRPIIGGLGGYSLSGIFTDGTGEHEDAVTLGFVMAGAGFGQWSKYLSKTNRLSEFDRKKLTMAINKRGYNMLRRNINMFVSGGVGARLDTTGGWAKIVGNLLLNTSGVASESVETKVNRDTRKFITDLMNTLGDSSEGAGIFKSSENEATRKVIGELLNGFIKESDIRVGYKGLTNDYKALTTQQVDDIKRLAPKIKLMQTELADSVEDVGIKFKRLDDSQYGITQLYNIENIIKNEQGFYESVVKALKIEKPRATAKEIEKEAEAFINNIRGREGFKKGDRDFSVDSMFDEGGKMRPLTNHFERHRLINNPSARLLLAKEGFLDLDVLNTMSTYAQRTIKIRNFAEVFGANGEFLSYVFRNIDDVSRAGGRESTEFGKQYKKDIVDAINTFWGVKDLNPDRNKLATSLTSLMTVLANTTYLPRVTISSLGDLVQPMQNSGFWAGTRAIVSKAAKQKGSFSKQAGFKYDAGWEKELNAMMAHGDDPLDTFRNNANKWNTRFFTAIGLKPLTNFARGFSYDTGVYRAFSLSRKNKLSRANLEELNQLGISKKDLDTLKKYKSAQQAFDSDEGRKILDLAGQGATDRDTIIPGIGNRAMFTQSRNPYVKSFGQFLSWAQAKTSQTNQIVKRIEQGDAALAVRLLGLTTIYNGIQEFKNVTNPNYDLYAEKNNFYWENDDNLKKAMLLSGNFAPYQAQEILSTLAYHKSGWNGASASMGYTSEALGATGNMVINLFEGEAEEAFGPLLKLLPTYREYEGIRRQIDPNYEPIGKAKGGEITNVPNAPEEPDERIDKMTGMPYDQQAGTAFVDEEDPLRRLGFVGGGEVDPLRRLGFGQGSKVLNALRRTSV